MGQNSTHRRHFQNLAGRYHTTQSIVHLIVFSAHILQQAPAEANAALASISLASKVHIIMVAVRYACSGALLATCLNIAQAREPIPNDYPTVARADYIFACMAVSGQTRGILEKCACSIDVIASILPYERYEQAETVLSVRRAGGEKVSPLHTAAQFKDMIADLRRAQVEAEIRCFQAAPSSVSTAVRR